MSWEWGGGLARAGSQRLCGAGSRDPLGSGPMETRPIVGKINDPCPRWLDDRANVALAAHSVSGFEASSHPRYPGTILKSVHAEERHDVCISAEAKTRTFGSRLKKRPLLLAWKPCCRELESKKTARYFGTAFLCRCLRLIGPSRIAKGIRHTGEHLVSMGNMLSCRELGEAMCRSSLTMGVYLSTSPPHQRFLRSL